MAQAESRIAGHNIASAPGAPTDARGARGVPGEPVSNIYTAIKAPPLRGAAGRH